MAKVAKKPARKPTVAKSATVQSKRKPFQTIKRYGWIVVSKATGEVANRLYLLDATDFPFVGITRKLAENRVQRGQEVRRVEVTLQDAAE